MFGETSAELLTRMNAKSEAMNGVTSILEKAKGLAVSARPTPAVTGIE